MKHKMIQEGDTIDTIKKKRNMIYDDEIKIREKIDILREEKGKLKQQQEIQKNMTFDPSTKRITYDDIKAVDDQIEELLKKEREFSYKDDYRYIRRKKEILELSDEEIDFLDVALDAKGAGNVQDLINKNLVDKDCLEVLIKNMLLS